MKRNALSEDQSMVLELIVELAESEINPRSESIDHEEKYSPEAIAVLAEAGLIGCMVPEELDGPGLNYWSQTVVVEETAKACASTAWTVAGAAAVIEVLLKHGTDQQKENFLARIMEGSLAAAAGSDAVYGAPFKVSATAEKTDAGYVLSGVKKNVPNAADDEIFLIAAQCGDEVIWAFAEAGMEGMSVQAAAKQLGMKGCPLGDLILDGCLVSEDALVKGNVAKTLDDAQTLYMAAIAAGIAQGAAKEAVTYVNQREQFKRKISSFENTQQVMAELLSKAEAARALVWYAAQEKDSDADYAVFASMAKVVAADTASVMTRQCLQFMGGYGYSREYPIERKMRDAKMTELLGGATIDQKAKIAGKLVVE